MPWNEPPKRLSKTEKKLIKIIEVISFIMLPGTFRFSRFKKAPGTNFLRVIDFLYSKKIKERVFEQIISDIRKEYNDALMEKRVLKSKWIHTRGIIDLFIAVFSQSFVSITKKVIDLWKIF